MVPENIHAVSRDKMARQLVDLVIEHYGQRGEELRGQACAQGVEGLDLQRDFERSYLLQILDRLWMDHIDALDVMRAGISFRAVGQRDPLVEFKNEAFHMFEELKAAIQHYTVDALLKLMRDGVTVTVQRPEPQRKMPLNLHTNVDELAKASGQAKNDTSSERAKGTQGRKAGAGSHHSHANGHNGAGTGSRSATSTKVGRNDPCPCGSGKKYKRCHGM
jgi:preprotein translocase subunit SecA